MTCPTCGVELSPGARECQLCGSRVAAQSPDPEDSKRAVVSSWGYVSERAARDACADFDRTPSGACYPRRVGG